VRNLASKSQVYMTASREPTQYSCLDRSAADNTQVQVYLLLNTAARIG
jgi:hypothetical protein